MARAESPGPEPTGGGQGLALVGVSKRYGATQVLHPLDLAVGGNEFVTILGPSGSGKTTVLRLVGGFVAPTTGRVLIDGQDVTAIPINRRPCHTVFQDYALFPHMSVAENVGYGLMVRGMAAPERRRKVAAVLEVVGLERLGERYPAELSGGQRQRTALARAIVLEPRLVLLDEPLAALDAALRRQMQGFLKEVQRRVRTTFLFVTHDQDEALTMADRIVVMRGGTIEQVGTPREVYWRPRTAFVAGFLGESNLIPVVARPGPHGLARVEGPLGAFTVTVAGRTEGNTLLALRPESLRLADAPERGEVGLAGEVAQVLFTGATSRLLVRVPGLGEPLLRVQLASRPGRDGPAPGEGVRLAFRPAEAVLVPP